MLEQREQYTPRGRKDPRSFCGERELPRRQATALQRGDQQRRITVGHLLPVLEVVHLAILLLREGVITPERVGYRALLAEREDLRVDRSMLRTLGRSVR